jgi:hypothetical protein
LQKVPNDFLEMRKGKILYFDYWTKGIKNFKLFDQQLKDIGYETKLLHLNSWRGIEDPDNQTIDGIRCFDIRYYKTNFLYKILEIERPLAVIILNSWYITDRTVIIACKKLGIKSIYVMHGDIMRDEFKESTVDAINARIKKTSRIKKISKHFTSTVANYLFSIWKYNWLYFFKPHIYKVLLKTFANPGAYMFFPPASFDIKTDMALVYGVLDRAFFENKFGDKEYVKTVGNPDLDKFFQAEHQLGDQKKFFFEKNGIPQNRPYITYIEESFVESNFWKNEDRINFLNEISSICDEEGYNLVVKLHPLTTKGPNRSTLDDFKNVKIIEEIDFPKLVYFTEICVCHFSTALIFPMLLDKPIIVPRWGVSANLLTLYSDKEVSFVATLNDFKNRIRTKNFIYQRTEYLNNYVPFRDGRTSERIANYVMELVN